MIAGDVIAAAQLPTLVFTPAPDAAGAGYASFTFSVQDSVGTFDGAPETITISVAPVNDTPVAVVDAAATNENTAVTTGDVLVNDALGDAPDHHHRLRRAERPGRHRGAQRRQHLHLHSGRQLQRHRHLHLHHPGRRRRDLDRYRHRDGRERRQRRAGEHRARRADLRRGRRRSSSRLGNGNRIAVSDPDAGASPLEVTLTAVQGTLTLAGIAGLTFTVGDGTADATMTFTGTQAAINAALDGMSFLPPLDYSGPASVTITTGDLGATGAGGPQSDTDTVNITVTVVAVNDAPTLDLDAKLAKAPSAPATPATFTEDKQAQSSSSTPPTQSLADVWTAPPSPR